MILRAGAKVPAILMLTQEHAKCRMSSMKILERPMAIAFGKNFPEVILGMTTMAYGIMLTSPPESLNFSDGHSLMMRYAPTWVWGLIFFALGLVSTIAILRRHGDLVRSSAKIMFFLWFFSAFLFAISLIASPVWILMLCMAMLYAGVSSEYRTKTKWLDGTNAPGPDR